MSRIKHIDPFFLVITDRDKGLFNVVGPMTDDNPWNERVCAAQNEGRHVNCQNPNLQNRETIIAMVKQQLGLEYTDKLIV